LLKDRAEIDRSPGEFDIMLFCQRAWPGSSRVPAVLILVVIGLITGPAAQSQTIQPPFDGDYSFIDLGNPVGVPGQLGGLTLLAGDPNTLLIGGNANNPTGVIMRIGITRDANFHITGFSGSAVQFATAPEIDGGLAYGPGGVLFYTGYNENLLGQIKPGSTAPDKIIDLDPLGVDRSVGSLNFVPGGFPGAGEIRLATYNTSGFYTADLTADGSGTYDISNIVKVRTVPGGPEGFIYVTPGSPVFTGPSMLFSEYGANRVSAYELDAEGFPIVTSRQDFMTGFFGVEGAFQDPLSGDFLFSTFAPTQRVIVVRGFAPVPEPTGIVGVGLVVVGLAGFLRRSCSRRRAAVEARV
jgi:hypothetical protein